MKLSEFPPVARYTMNEFHMFARLPQNGRKVDSHTIAQYRGDDWDVKHPIKNVTVVMNRLIKKVEDNKEAFRIRKEPKRTGHHKVEYWLETVEDLKGYEA